MLRQKSPFQSKKRTIKVKNNTLIVKMVYVKAKKNVFIKLRKYIQNCCIKKGRRIRRKISPIKKGRCGRRKFQKGMRDRRKITP